MKEADQRSAHSVKHVFWEHLLAMVWAFLFYLLLIYDTYCEMDLNRGKEHARKTCHSIQRNFWYLETMKAKENIYSVQSGAFCPEGQGCLCLPPCTREVSVSATRVSVCISVLSETLGNLVSLSWSTLAIFRFLS